MTTTTTSRPTCLDCVHWDEAKRCTLDIREARTVGKRFAPMCASFFPVK